MLVLALLMEIRLLLGSQLAWSFSCRNLDDEKIKIKKKILPRRVFRMVGKVWGSRQAWSWVVHPSATDGGVVLGHPFKGMEGVCWQVKRAGVARRSTK